MPLVLPEPDPVEHPAHYTQHPSGVECITITEHMGFCLGNAVKYIWRADLKGDEITDLRKARWYLDREIERREAAASPGGLIGPGSACRDCGAACSDEGGYTYNGGGVYICGPCSDKAAAVSCCMCVGATTPLIRMGVRCSCACHDCPNQTCPDGC